MAAVTANGQILYDRSQIASPMLLLYAARAGIHPNEKEDKKMSFFITDALAATNGAATAHHGNPMFGTVLMLVGFVLIFYFLIWRPQSRRAKQQKDLIAALRVGEEVMTSSGIIGKITELDGTQVKIEIATGVEVRMQKSSGLWACYQEGTVKSTDTKD